MRRLILGSLTIVTILFLTSSAQLSGQSAGSGTPFAGNPGIFQNFKAPVSSMNFFYASEGGKQILLHSPNPHAKELLTRFFGSTVASQWPVQPLLPRSVSRAVSLVPTVTGCGTASGTRFNLESGLAASPAVPQNEPPADFIVNRIAAGADLLVGAANDFRGFLGGLGGSISGFYAHRSSATACSPDFEMGNPLIPDPLHAGMTMFGAGDPRVTADSINDQFIYSDIRFNIMTAGVGLRRVRSTNILSTATCPSGTLSAVAAATCAGTTAVVLGASEEDLADFPQSTQDPRTTGTGAGDIYATWTNFDFDFLSSTEIEVVACKKTFASLTDCSPPKVVSDPDSNVQFSSVSVVPAGPSAGKITISYVNFTFGAVCSPAFSCQQIKLVVCTPNGAPAAPTCGAPVVAVTEKQPIPFFGLTNIQVPFSFRNNTIPVIANRANPTPATATGQTTFLVWERCGGTTALPFNFGLTCTDADIVMSTSTNLATFTAPTPVDASVGTHEFMPAISVDANQNVTNIAYYHTPDTNTYKNRAVVDLKQIPSGSTIPGAAILVTSVPDSPVGDGNIPFFAPAYGDYIGVAARGVGGLLGSRAYIGYTNDSRIAIYGTSSNTDSNNHVSKVTY